MNDRVKLWREKRTATETIELSFGPAVIRSSVSLLDLAGAGQIPTRLLVELDEIGGQAKKNAAKIPDDALARLTPALDAVAIAAFIDPPVAKKADDDHLSPDEIPFGDKYKVFLRLNREVEPLREFQPEPGESNGTPHPGDDLSHAAVSDTGD